MQVPTELSFRDLTETETNEARSIIDEQVAKLDRFGQDAISCRVAVDRPQANQRAGNPFRCHIRLTIPGYEELNVDHAPTDNDAHATMGHVIRHAFQSLARQLKRAEQVRRGDVKHHAGTPAGLRPV